MKATATASPDLHFWRERELGGACLLRARYEAHQFTRHVHDEMVVAVTEDGGGEVHTRQGSDVGGPGTVWVFAPGEYHEGKVARDCHWAYRGLYLDAAALSALTEVFDEGAENEMVVPPRLYRDPQLARMLLAAHAHLERGAPLMEREALWWSAMGVFFGRYGHPPNLARAGPEPAKMRAVRDYIAANYDHDIGNRELAALAGLSRYHFVRSFRRAFGMPPHAYLNQMRLLAAKRLLKEGRSPGEAAAAVGFFDQSHLTRVFKRAYGITPAVYAVPARDRIAGRASRGTSPSGEGVS